jgi:hypothetical protein
MNKVYATLMIAVAALALAGCTMVKVSEAGKRVNMVTADQVFNCTKIGTVSTTVLDNIVGIPRNEQKVQAELDRLARDQAVLLKANTLVRDSIRDGLGSYTAYNCP